MDTIDVIPGSRSAREILAEARELVEPGLRAAVDTLPPPSRHIAGYHFGWWDADGSPARHDAGKALRPALVLSSARAVGAEAAAAAEPGLRERGP